MKSSISNITVVRAIYIVLLLTFFVCLTVQGFPNNKNNNFELIQSDTVKFKKIERRIERLHNQGFITASFDSIFNDSGAVSTAFHKGEAYRWGNFLFNDSLKEDLRALKKLQGKKVNLKRLESKLNSVLLKKVSTGYPFLKLQLSLQVVDNYIIDCTVETDGYNSPVYIDTIVLPTKARISKGYITNYLDIKEGNLYNHVILMSVEEKIEKLSFVELKTPLISRFSTQGAIIELPIEAKMSGSFGGMLGFTTSETDNKLQITGDISLKLQNAFKRGEFINLSWKSAANKSQTLLVKSEFPYLFSSPFGLYANINIQKKDTTLINTDNEFSGIIHLKGLNQLRAGINYRTNSFLTSTDTTLFDTKTVFYNGAYIFNNVDNWYNPSKGVEFEINLKVGNRQKKDSTMAKNAIYSLYSHCVKYWRLSARNVLATSIEAGTLKFKDKLWASELFKIGGMYSIRGFDEEAIFASEFIFSTIEYRYRFEQRSNAFVFFQFGGYKSESILRTTSSYLFSGGIGTMLNTGVGMFTVMYAMGKSKEQDLRLRTAKIHFGYITRF